MARPPARSPSLVDHSGRPHGQRSNQERPDIPPAVFPLRQEIQIRREVALLSSPEILDPNRTEYVRVHCAFVFAHGLHRPMYNSKRKRKRCQKTVLSSQFAVQGEVKNRARSEGFAFHAPGALPCGAGHLCGAGPRKPDRRAHRLRRGLCDACGDQLWHAGGDLAARRRQDGGLLGKLRRREDLRRAAGKGTSSTGATTRWGWWPFWPARGTRFPASA